MCSIHRGPTLWQTSTDACQFLEPERQPLPDLSRVSRGCRSSGCEAAASEARDELWQVKQLQAGFGAAP